MARKFKCLHTFTSREFNGTHYVAGMVYTIRDNNIKLETMCQRWLKARLFKMHKDMEMFGSLFQKGKVSYCLEDSFASVVDGWVNAGKAEYVEGGLITFDFDEGQAGSLTGSGTTGA